MGGSDIVKKHKQYKETTVSFYDGLKKDFLDCPSCEILIERLTDLEGRQCQIAPGDYLMGIAHDLALTPTDELGKLSRTFDDILNFKETSLRSHFDELDKVASNDVRRFIQNLKQTEISLVQGIKSRKDRFGL